METAVEFKSNVRIEIEGDIKSVEKMLFGIRELAERLGVKVELLKGHE